jgi:hypothetical protein
MDKGDVYNLGYELRAPKMLTKLVCLVLIIENGQPRVDIKPSA